MPKRKAKITIGSSTLMAWVASMPQIASEPTPCWKTSTISPHAAATDSRFSSTAFSGRSSERKARASSTKVSTLISAIRSGKLP